eukprot:1161371-Pelagomonas_calceolata.AAC.4
MVMCKANKPHGLTKIVRQPGHGISPIAPGPCRSIGSRTIENMVKVPVLQDKLPQLQRMDRGAEYLAHRHAGQTADLNLHTLVAIAKQGLAAGEPCARCSAARI